MNRVSKSLIINDRVFRGFEGCPPSSDFRPLRFKVPVRALSHDASPFFRPFSFLSAKKAGR